jgi:membrane protease YdiL (CAAX protease family)
MPLLATAVMLTVLVGIVHIPAIRSIPAPPGLDPGIGRGLLMQIPIAITVLFLTYRLAGFANVGLQARGAWTSMALSAPMLALALADRIPEHVPALPALAAALALAAAVGFIEELYGRGLLVTLLGGRRHALLAVLGSSVLFAYLHMPIYLEKFGLRDALLRCTASAAFSATFAIIRLRSGSLVGPILFHAINDAQFLVAEPGVPSSSAPARVSAMPILLGCVTTLIYWVACRRAIHDGEARVPSPRPN